MKPGLMLRAVTTVLTVLLATQAMAFVSARDVCRFTGKTVAPCPCPSSQQASVGSESCCRHVEGRLPGLPLGQLLRAVALPMPMLAAGFEPLAAAPVLAVAVPRTLVRSTASPPRLYVTLQQLLL